MFLEKNETTRQNVCFDSGKAGTWANVACEPSAIKLEQVLCV